jgi:hypothetical protein
VPAEEEENGEYEVKVHCPTLSLLTLLPPICWRGAVRFVRCVMGVCVCVCVCGVFAKVLRTRVVNGAEESRVHWVGWGSQYDEWKPSSEINLHQEEEGEDKEADVTKKKKKKKVKVKEEEKEDGEEEEEGEKEKEKAKEDGAQVLVADSQNEREQEEKGRKAKKRARSRKGKEKAADDEEEEEEEDDDDDKDKDYEDGNKKNQKKKRKSLKRKEDDEEDEEEEDEEERPRKMMWTAKELAQLEEAAEEASMPGAVSWVQVAAQLGNRTPKYVVRPPLDNLPWVFVPRRSTDA